MPREPLRLNHDDLKKKVDVLFNKLITEKDPAYLKEFLNNPGGLFLKELMPEEYKNVSKQSISDGNRLLFSVLANKKFNEWLNDYHKNQIIEVKKGNSATINNDKFHKDISEAILKLGDQDLIANLLKTKINSSNLGRVGVVHSSFIFFEFDTTLSFIFHYDYIATGAYNKSFISELNSLEIPINQLRSLTEQLISHAEELKKKGVLSIKKN